LHLGSCDRIEIGKKDTVITKTTLTILLPKEITDLTAQIKLQDNEGEKTTERKNSKIAGGISTVMVEE
jgi:hypothetical protein